MDRRVHITGASGSGTTTLGKALARHIDAPHFDSDDYFWLATDPPFLEAKPCAERLALLEPKLRRARSFVLSGSNRGWGDSLIPYYTLVVFLYVPAEVRLQRLRARERDRYGAAIEPGGRMHAQYLEFIAWAAQYDEGPATMRSLRAHEIWLDALPCPVLRLEASRTVEEHLEVILRSGSFG